MPSQRVPASGKLARQSLIIRMRKSVAYMTITAFGLGVAAEALDNADVPRNNNSPFLTKSDGRPIADVCHTGMGR